MGSDRPVVVGVDASPGAYDAVRYAAGEAGRRGSPLAVVHAFTWPWIDLPLTEEDLADLGGRDTGDRLLARTGERIRAEYSDVAVSTALVEGHAAAVLVDRSRTAGLLVVGHRGEGGFADLAVGSVAMHAAAHAHCPLVVVRGRWGEPGAPVVVGVDGSEHSDHTVRFTVEAAAVRKSSVLAVAVGPAHPHEADLHRATAVEQALTGVLADAVAAHPQVSVQVQLRYDRSPAAALIRAADGAGLAVVGSRGHGGLRGLLLGSVGRALIEHAPCPVAIVRPPNTSTT
jgi:nucleotide-binding universal stress UspA family protein